MSGPAGNGSGNGFIAEGGHGAMPATGVPVAAEPAEATARAAEQVNPEASARRGAEQVNPEVRHDWPLWEVFVRGKRGLNHVHVGSLHAADAEMALGNARDLYTRRNEGVSIWVARAADIAASSPREKDPFFAPAADKVYRHPTFYQIPDSVPYI